MSKKNLVVSEETHRLAKIAAATKGQKLGVWIDDVIRRAVRHRPSSSSTRLQKLAG